MIALDASRTPVLDSSESTVIGRRALFKTRASEPPLLRS